jgi:hypothetical protein
MGSRTLSRLNLLNLKSNPKLKMHGNESLNTNTLQFFELGFFLCRSLTLIGSFVPQKLFTPTAAVLLKPQIHPSSPSSAAHQTSPHQLILFNGSGVCVYSFWSDSSAKSVYASLALHPYVEASALRAGGGAPGVISLGMSSCMYPFFWFRKLFFLVL